MAKFTPSPYRVQSDAGWHHPLFAVDVKAVKDGAAQSSLVGAVRKFWEWRADCEDHEGREAGKLEHMLRVWELLDKRGKSSASAMMVEFFRSWGLPFTSRPTWPALNRLAWKRVREMSPLTRELRHLGRDEQ